MTLRGPGAMAEFYVARANDALALAIDLDEKKRRKEAIPQYVNACEHAIRALKLEPNPKERARLVNRLRGWLERAEDLKRHELLSKLPEAPSPAKDAPRPKENPLDSVIGLEHVKQALREAIILPSTQPQIFVGARKPWKGILLYGPPGTGKTFIASKVAEEAGCQFFSVSSSDIVGKYLGESEKSIRELFAKARAAVSGHPTRRAVIFIDEVDSIGQARGSSNEKESDVRLLTELLRQMDGVGADNSQIVVIGATNLPQNLDPALRRRFERKLLIPLPDLCARAQVLAKHLGPPGAEHSLTASHVVQVARRLNGCSGADIASFANEVLLRPVRKCINASHFVRKANGRLEPCSPLVRGALPMRMLDKNFESEALEVPLASISDAQEIVSTFRPSTAKTDFELLEIFDREFGERLDKKIDDEIVSQRELEATVDRQWFRERVVTRAVDAKDSVVELVSTITGAVMKALGRTAVPS